MNSIVLAALYLYAATNTARAAFDAALLSDAFAKKQSRPGSQGRAVSHGTANRRTRIATAAPGFLRPTRAT
jgi:hypothetical protein